MSIISGQELWNEIERGNIRIEPFDRDSVGPASVDLQLSYALRLYKNVYKPIEAGEKPQYKDYTYPIDLRKETFMLMPGFSALGITMERITLADNICGWLEGRSSYARIGLLVHISASFMQPGIDNHQVLELFNFGNNPIVLKEGMKACQFIFQKATGNVKYDGQFSTQNPENFLK
jgi:dCTP deaminase